MQSRKPFASLVFFLRLPDSCQGQRLSLSFQHHTECHNNQLCPDKLESQWRIQCPCGSFYDDWPGSLFPTHSFPDGSFLPQVQRRSYRTPQNGRRCPQWTLVSGFVRLSRADCFAPYFRRYCTLSKAMVKAKGTGTTFSTWITALWRHDKTS